MTAAAKRQPRRMSSAARHQQLLDATMEVIAAGGFGGVSIEGVARSAGVSRALVYEHFGDLAALLEAVVAREMTRALSQVSETTLTDLSGGAAGEIMFESLRAYLQAVHDHPTTWRLVLMPPEGAPALLHQSIERGRDAVLEQMTRAVRAALVDDRDSPDAELSARLLSAIADEYARLVLRDPVRFPPERLLRHARWAIDQVPA